VTVKIACWLKISFFSDFLCYIRLFFLSLQKIIWRMKKYKLLEENLEGTMAQEPAAYPRMASQDTAVLARGGRDVAEIDDDEEIELPYSPNFAHNEEELEQAILEVEAHWDDPNYWIS